VDLPLVYKRDDRRHRCGASLVDVVMGHSRAVVERSAHTELEIDTDKQSKSDQEKAYA